MDGVEICFELKKRGWTQTKIARKLKVSQSAVSQIIYNRARSKRIRRFIAAILNLDATAVWKDRPKRFYQ
ncbi:MAG TPA: helix-turn-helix transcriptional regulator [Candidatus Manganitrophaceae bacterium]|nr:helix-turn-helix transcriptional regulator [Candidatus Manganitrophaceae bacterium]